MALHLLRLAVGITDLDHLQRVQILRVGEVAKNLRSTTRRLPTRIAELTDGGSLYWVIKGVILVRQSLLAIEAGTDDEDGSPCAVMTLKREWVRTVPTHHRPFQGWRYLKPETAPADLDGAKPGDLPAALQAELRALGIL